MGKTTQTVKSGMISGLAFFSFLLLSASQPTPTEPIIAEKESEEIIIANDLAINDPALFSTALSNKESNSQNELLCSVTAPLDVTANTSDDGGSDCGTIVTLGEAVTTDCLGFTAEPFVDGNKIDPGTFKFSPGTTVVIWKVVDGFTLLASDTQEVTVKDNEVPQVTCIADQNRSTNSNICTYTVVGTEFDPAGYSDNCSGVTITNDFNDSSFLAGATFPKGTTTVTWTVTDDTGNFQTCSFDVVVTDNEPPEITCIPDQNRDTNSNSCTYTAVGTEFDPTDFNDNCPGSTITNDFNGGNSLAGAKFPKGTTTVTWTVSDATGNDSASCSFDVVVTDNELPEVTCISNQNRGANSNSCTYTVEGTEFDPAAYSDNCTVATVTNDFNGENSLAGAVFPLGTTTVTWTVTDDTNNAVSCSFDVVVTDNELPEITCISDQNRDTNSNSCTYTSVGTEFDPAGFSDNCPGVTITNDFNNSSTLAGEVFLKGTTTVTWTVTDATGNNVVSCSFDVVVTDNELPNITCITDQNRSTKSNVCTYTAVGPEFDPAGYSDNCSGVTITNDFNHSSSLAGAVFPKGTTTVTWTVTDATGNNAASCSFDVVVMDDELPEITCISDQNRDTDSNSCTYTAVGTEFDPAAYSDNCTVATVTNDFNGGNSLAGAVFPLGTTTVTWTVTDDTNNAVSCSFDVVVTDNELPEITCISDQNRDTDSNSCTYTAVGTEFDPASFSDNCPGVTITNDFNDSSSLAGAVFPKGTTTVTWTVTDATGNNAVSCSFDVVVTDNELPSISAPAAVSGVFTSNDGSGDCFSIATLGMPVTDDNCGILSVEAYVDGSPINPSTHLFPKGTTTVTWEVTDVNNNKNTATQTVTVEDDEVPVFPALSQVQASTSDNGTGDCSTTVMLGYPSITDNCSALTIKAYIGNTQIDPELHKFPVGLTTVTWKATDSSGNIGVKEQEVLVEDDERPIPDNLNAITWGCALTVPTPTASDNCDQNITVTADRSTNFTQSGSIFWTFTDDNNNSTTVEQKVTINPLSATVTTQRTSVYGRNDGSATVNPAGGVAPYTYEWRLAGNSSVVSTAQNATNLAAGTYEVTITDVNNCPLVIEANVISAVLPANIATSACYDVKDYIRTSTFEVDLNNVVGGVGDPNNFTYEWNFGPDADPKTATGPQEHTVTWENSGDKVVYLTIIDEADYEQTFPIAQYVGGCFEGCGETENFDMNTGNFFIGDAEGNPLTGENCGSVTEKYMWIDVIVNSNAYALSAEMNYAVNNGEGTISRKAIGCFSEVIGYNNSGKEIYKKIPTGLFRLFKVQESGTATDMITWQCGSTFTVEGINIRWTNQENMGCNEGTKPMCFGPDSEVIVKTPLMVDATPEDILCKGESTGSITVDAAGGTKPYQYSLNGPVTRAYQDSEYFYNLPAGQYTFSVKDADETVTTGTVNISEPGTKVNASVGISQVITCYGGTGEAKVTPSGGVGPYTYSWSSGATSQTASGLLAGVNYTVTVTDANNCSVIKPVTLTQPEQLTLANAGVDGSFGCGITTTTLSANTPGTGEKGTWNIISGSNGNIDELNNPNATFSGVPGESYTLEWIISRTDGTCANSDEVVINFSEECSTLNFDGIDDHVIMGDQYNLANTNFTLEAWVRPKSVNGTKTILSKRNTGDMAAGGYDLNINNGAVSFRWNGNLVYTSHKVGTDRWYHVAVVFTNGVPEIFVDGISIPLTTSIAAAGTPKTISYPFMIGAANYEHTPQRPKNLFHGWIEEVRIWKTALAQDQLRFMMNQRIEPASDGVQVKGEILPMNVPGDLQWSDLTGYYRLKVTEIDAVNGTTPDLATNKVLGQLRNIEEEQENSAPLPYISNNDGNWWTDITWLYPDYWDAPNSTGINGQKIDWNIAYVTHDLHSGNQNIKLLGLLLKSGKLDMLGINPTSVTQAGTGNGLTITTYLDLDGFIDLNGESQLVQTEGSLLEGFGRLDRDQQGTGSSYNYNYFSSPVSTLGNAPNSGYSIADVLRSGTYPNNPKTIDFNYQYHYADGPLSDPLKISSYWLYKFHGIAGQYNQWHWIGPDGHLEAGEGYTMKGSSGHLGILDLQNYVFTGMPNNGPITFTVGTDENRLIGNPYPSAIDADKFIQQNLKNSDGKYVFNGTLYFWSHFKGKTHYLTRYEGGYAMYNLMGSAKAVANDARINATGEIGGMEPRQFIPPGQAFFINTVKDDEIPDGTTKLPLPVGMVGGEIKFDNSQRIFQKEDPAKAVFHSKEKPQVGTTKKSEKEPEEKDTRKKIWLKSRSPMGYYRQLLVGADSKTTIDFDPGYDAPLYDMVDEDMYWKRDHMELVIQGVPDFHKGIELPLELRTKHEGEFTIEIDKLKNIPDDFAILLKDTLVSELHDLRKSQFTFMASPGTITDRFSIVFLNKKPEPEEISEEEKAVLPVELFYVRDENVVNIYNPDLIPVIEASLYNLNGQHLQKYDYIPTENLAKLAIPLKTLGVYILKVKTVQGTKTLKFIMN